MTEHVFAIAAHIDLLGFADHLAVGATDVRTEIGQAAIERLAAMEGALRLLENERQAHRQLYPDTLQISRFNDALFLGIDILGRQPAIGASAIAVTITRAEAKKRESMNEPPASFVLWEKDALEAAKFLGLVARVHAFINEQEGKKIFPGCRTVVATGMRARFADRTGAEDYFSANLAVANAYLASEAGSRAGLRGSAIYVEENVARVIAFSQCCTAILALTKFFWNWWPLDPYQSPGVDVVSLSNPYWSTEEPVAVEVLRRPHTYRRLNPGFLRWLQLAELIWSDLIHRDNAFDRNLKQLLEGPTPSLEQINLRPDKYWILNTGFSLEDDFGDLKAPAS